MVDILIFESVLMFLHYIIPGMNDITSKLRGPDLKRLGSTCQRNSL